MIKNKVIYLGPELIGSKNTYGGGMGGIVSASKRMVVFFEKNKIEYIYFSYSIRENNRLWPVWLPVRLIYDVIRLARIILKNRRSSIVHLVADGGLSVFRSLIFLVLVRVFGISAVTDVRGNALVAYSKCNEGVLISYAWHIVLTLSSFVLVQGKETSSLLSSKFPVKVVYHPNWVNPVLTPERARNTFENKIIDVVFVGYCYEGKGVFDCVEGCQLACESGLLLTLTFVGQEHPTFSAFLDQLSHHSALEIKRHGKLDRGAVLNTLAHADVFLFPSYHFGEGHPNVINEAMLAQLAIITTHVGAVDDVLDDSSAFFVRPKNPGDIAARLLEIDVNRFRARAKGKVAYDKVVGKFSEGPVLEKLLAIYQIMGRECVK